MGRRLRRGLVLRAVGVRRQRPWLPRGAWKYQSVRSFGLSLMPVLFLFGRSFMGWVMMFIGMMLSGGRRGGRRRRF